MDCNRRLGKRGVGAGRPRNFVSYLLRLELKGVASMRRISIVLAVLVAAAMTATAALATSAHFKKGGSPTCTISGTGTTSTSTTCTGTLAGLGGVNLAINTTVEGAAVYQCQNGGGNTAPGQNRVL